MRCLNKFLLLSSVLIAWSAYFIYTPVPEGFDDPWKIRVFNAFRRVQLATIEVAASLGFDSSVNLTRKLSRVPKRLQGPLELEVKAHDTKFDGIPVRIYKPRTATDTDRLPVLVYYHGGGHIFGSLDLYDAFSRRVVMQAAVALISVDYRLAPENPFPAPLDDCHKATLYVMEHAAELGVDPSKVQIGGDSAGGNLAAAVAVRMKNSNPPLVAQVLIYPSLQKLSMHLPSYFLPWTPILERPIMPPMPLMYYLGEADPSFVEAMLNGSHVTQEVRQRYSKYVDYRKLPESYRQGYTEPTFGKVNAEVARRLEPFITNPEANPLLNDDLSGLPPAFMLTAGHDPLRDEGILYALRLQEAGIPVEHQHYEQGFHGMTVLTEPPLDFAVAIRSVQGIANYVRSRVSP